MFAHNFYILLPLVFLTVGLCYWVNRIFLAGLRSVEDKLSRLHAEYKRLLEENNQLSQVNTGLISDLGDIMSLYDATKQICKNLDEPSIFTGFLNQAKKYVHFKECIFVKDNIPPGIEKDDIALPLRMNRRIMGYLLCRGVEEFGKAKFSILAHQFFLGIKRAMLYKQVQELAISDSLTGVSSRRYCLDRLKQELLRSKRFSYPFCVLMIDIDYFKTYNDRYGHLVGDAILKEVSSSIKENIRQIDIVGRYGGEEFCIILAETDKEQALLAAGRIRQAIENKLIRVYDENVKITVSIGVSIFPDQAKDVKDLIDCADQALYKAKQKGRNRVCLYGSLDDQR